MIISADSSILRKRAAVVAPPVRLRGIIIASNSSGAGIVKLTTTSQAGSNLFTADVPTGDVINLNFP